MWFKKNKHQILLISLSSMVLGGFGCSQERQDLEGGYAAEQTVSARPAKPRDIKVEILLKDKREDLGKSISDAPSAAAPMMQGPGQAQGQGQYQAQGQYQGQGQAGMPMGGMQGGGMQAGPQGYGGGAVGGGFPGGFGGANIDVPVGPAPGFPAPWFGPGYPIFTDGILTDVDDNRADDGGYDGCIVDDDNTDDGNNCGGNNTGDDDDHGR